MHISCYFIHILLSILLNVVLSGSPHDAVSIYLVGVSLSEPHTSKSLQNIRSTVSRNLVNHSIFGCTYVQQCHGIRYTSQDFVRSTVSRNSRLTVSRNLINQSIFGCTYVQQCHRILDTSQSIVNYCFSTFNGIMDFGHYPEFH